MIFRCAFVATSAMVAALQSSLLSLARADPSDNSSTVPLIPSPVCYHEPGFDYPGNDLGSVAGSVDGCCEACADTTGCVVWTWTDHDGGTCWLKSGRGEVVVNAAATSAVLSISNVLPVCRAMHNYDYEGNDIGFLEGPASACCDACHETLGCRAYSWTSHIGGTCWFKSKVDKLVYNPDAQSALAYPYYSDLNVCKLQYDTDFTDNDIGSAPSGTADGCCEICQNTVNCKAFSWTDHDGGTCWLKSALGEAVKVLNAVSSVVCDLPHPGCALEDSVDYIGYDIGSAPSANAQGCCSICKQTDGCGAFSWSNYGDGTCWLKSVKGETVSAPGVVSSVI